MPALVKKGDTLFIALNSHSWNVDKNNEIYFASYEYDGKESENSGVKMSEFVSWLKQYYKGCTIFLLMDLCQNFEIKNADKALKCFKSIDNFAMLISSQGLMNVNGKSSLLTSLVCSTIAKEKSKNTKVLFSSIEIFKAV